MWGKTARILALVHEGGKSQSEIAREVGCTTANVAMTLKRYSTWRHTTIPLGQKHVTWLSARAKKKGVTIDEAAAALLRAAISREIANAGE